MKEMKVKKSMVKSVAFVKPTDTLRGASDLMEEFDFRHLPVLDNGKVVGILSDRDILRYSTQNGEFLEVPEMPVADAMSAIVLTCRPDDLISDIAQMMLTMKIDAIPITDENEELRGLITSSDLLRMLVNLDQEQLKQHAEFRANYIDIEMFQ